jgi:hypothetical protein
MNGLLIEYLKSDSNLNENQINQIVDVTVKDQMQS